MRRRIHRFPTLGIAFLLAVAAGYTTGQRAYLRGDYARAVHQSTDRLKSAPENAKALEVLSKALPAAQKTLHDEIDRAMRSTNRFKWESVISAYSQLNGLAYAIRTTPAAQGLFQYPRIYQEELDDARSHAAQARYEAAAELIAQETRDAASEALHHLSILNQISPGYLDIDVQTARATDLATLKVVIEPVTCENLNLDIAFFEARLHGAVSSWKSSAYVRFYTAEEALRAGLSNPDHRIEIRIKEFRVPDATVTETRETFSEDNVLIGQTRSKPPQNVYGTVKAHVRTWEKTIAVTGMLDLRIVNVGSNRALHHKKLPGESVWRNEWGTYRGDERALPAKLRKRVRQTAEPEPSRQFLFEALADGLFAAANEQIRQFYAGQRYPD